jgi:catechol 2,3-dioxygenase-like lactoylglutathione lyase family enzyme
MRDLSRREALGYSALALSALTVRGPGLAEPVKEKIKAEASITNPLASRNSIFTIVTPDMGASIHFYRDVMGFELVKQGKLEGRLPTVAGVGGAGRKYALVRARENIQSETGMIRLLEAPSGATANRPRPGSNIWNPGFAVIEGWARDIGESYRQLTAAGVKTITEPLYYFHDDIKLLPGATGKTLGNIELKTYCAFGPAGEQMFLSGGISRDRQPWPAWQYPGLHSPYTSNVIVCLDRWPVWDFYEKAFGLKVTKDGYSGQDNICRLIGAPLGTYYRLGGVGDGSNIEWNEYRQWNPADTTIYPTDLDRTGAAMVTMLVDDLAQVRSMVTEAGIKILGEGALPTPGAKYQDGLYVRGAVGELIEVIGRNA